MQTSVLIGAKKLWICQNLWCVCTDKGVEPVRTFCRQGRKGLNVLQFSADVFYGRLLRLFQKD